MNTVKLPISEKKRLMIYIIIDIIVILLVIACFRLIEERRIAAMYTSFIFITSALGIMAFEGKHPDRNKWVLISNLIFLLTAALPILALRLLFWDQVFDQIQWNGIQAKYLHQASTYLFLFKMLLAKAVDSIKRFT